MDKVEWEVGAIAASTIQESNFNHQGIGMRQPKTFIEFHHGMDKFKVPIENEKLDELGKLLNGCKGGHAVLLFITAIRAPSMYDEAIEAIQKIEDGRFFDEISKATEEAGFKRGVEWMLEVLGNETGGCRGDTDYVSALGRVEYAARRRLESGE